TQHVSPYRGINHDRRLLAARLAAEQADADKAAAGCLRDLDRLRRRKLRHRVVRKRERHCLSLKSRGLTETGHRSLFRVNSTVRLATTELYAKDRTGAWRRPAASSIARALHVLHDRRRSRSSDAAESPMKSALVTGAAQGLGATIAERLAGDGYRVALLDADGERVGRRAATLPDAIALGVDITDEAAVDAMAASLSDAFGGAPDVLVNNAGIVRFGNLLEHSLADFRRVLDVNLTGAFIVTKAIARGMLARGSGAIINITSLNAIAVSPDAGAYPAAKAALATLTEQFALVLGPHGIRVNAIAPGFIDAGMSAPIYADAEARELRSASVPIGSLGTADDVANAVLFLASEKARYVHGHQ